MDWNKQAVDMMKTWTGTQQKIWDHWVETMQTMAATPMSAESWQKAVDAWRATVRQTLDAQIELTKLWANGVNEGSKDATAAMARSGVSTPMTVEEWTNSVVELTRSITATQVGFAENWSNLLKQADPATMMKAWDTGQAQQVLTYWQDAAQKAVEAQAQLAKMMTATGAQQSVTRVEVEGQQG
ncbi:hypothetical protein HC891_07460 [Candidatus Gracilibacteria bacterium]|nr:hypothetical protein [Candidatus Gracilibacteria bacterium]